MRIALLPSHFPVLLALGVIVGLGPSPAVAADEPGPVEVVRSEDGQWTLLRGGEPYFVKGAGGSSHLAELAAAGNSIRTWGIDDETGALLDRAHAEGLSVTVGLWMGHKRHGFDYDNRGQVEAQLEQMCAAVRTFKDHPAVLAWGIGNEVETGQHDSIAMWRAIEEAAAAIKEIDPGHPTVSVIAELGPEESNLRHLAEHCPSIDIIGVNAYDHAATAAARIAAFGVARPCLLTEYGPPLPGNEIVEPTSTEKAAIYRSLYEDGIAGGPNCLGGYSFVWGAKREMTDTYFGQFLASGERLAQAEVFHGLFGAEPPANRCPVAGPIVLRSDPGGIKVGTEVPVSWAVTDPDGDPLTYRWELKEELVRTVGGDATWERPAFASSIVVGEGGGATLRHGEPGVFRLYAYAFDGEGNAATASARIVIKPDIELVPSPRAELPYALYRDGAFAQPFVASGYQGPVAGSIRMATDHADDPQAGESCIRISSDAAANWIGVSLQSPANDWGARPGGLDFSGATSLTFWARGEGGGEAVTIALGAIPDDQVYFDTARVEKAITLTAEWQSFTVDLDGRDLSRIKTPLFWSASTAQDGIVFYLDSIVIE